MLLVSVSHSSSHHKGKRSISSFVFVLLGTMRINLQSYGDILYDIPSSKLQVHYLGYLMDYRGTARFKLSPRARLVADLSRRSRAVSASRLPGLAGVEMADIANAAYLWLCAPKCLIFYRQAKKSNWTFSCCRSFLASLHLGHSAYTAGLHSRVTQPGDCAVTSHGLPPPWTEPLLAQTAPPQTETNFVRTHQLGVTTCIPSQPNCKNNSTRLRKMRLGLSETGDESMVSSPPSRANRPTTREALDAAIARFTKRNARSLELHKQATEKLPGGNTRTQVHTTPFPVYMKSGCGYQVTSEDRHT